MAPEKILNLKTHRFAWNGISFLVPVDWNLSAHKAVKGVFSIEMEDDVAIRLQAEWMSSNVPIKTEVVQKRYAEMSKEFDEVAEKISTITGMPERWIVLRYIMPDKRKLFIAYFISQDAMLFIFLRFHFDSSTKYNPKNIIQLITSSFCHHNGDIVPWEFYDISFQISSKFMLTDASLKAGSKLMIFQWRLRRFFIWHFSLADIILKETGLQEWAVKFLSNLKILRGPVFQLDENGNITAKKRIIYPFGYYEEIGRQCFKYNVGCRHIKEKNQIILWVYNYRHAKDLDHFKMIK